MMNKSVLSKDPFISIVVPIYNPGKYFQPCIDSLLAQTIDKSEIEIILVDDGSDDGSEAICDELKEAYPNLFRVIHQDPSGYASYPRNVGISVSQGEYILFHDADDILMPEACERLQAHALEWNSDVIVLRQEAVWPNGRRVIQPVHADKGDNIPCGDRLSECFVSHLNPRRLYRRELIAKQNLFFETTINEDLLFSLEALLASKVVSLAADYTYVWYIQRHDGNINSLPNTGPKSLDSRIFSIKRMLEAIEAAGAEEEAYPFFWKKLLEHPVYKALTTTMDSGKWHCSYARLHELREMLLPHWNMARVIELKRTERIVLELFMQGDFDNVPLARELSKKKEESFFQKVHQEGNAQTSFICSSEESGWLQRMSNYAFRVLAERQLGIADVHMASIPYRADKSVMVGFAVMPLAFAPVESMELKVGATVVPCHLLSYCEHGASGFSRLCIFWVSDSGAENSGNDAAKLFFTLGGKRYSFQQKFQGYPLPYAKLSAKQDAKAQIQALRNAVSSLSNMDASEETERLFKRCLIDSVLFPTVSSVVDNGGWRSEEQFAEAADYIIDNLGILNSCCFAKSDEKVVFDALRKERRRGIRALEGRGEVLSLRSVAKLIHGRRR